MTGKYGKGKTPQIQTPSMARDGAAQKQVAPGTLGCLHILVLVLWGLSQASRIWSFPCWEGHFPHLDFEGKKPTWMLEPGTRPMADALLSTRVQH